MATTEAVLEELEVDTGEDAYTIDIPLDDYDKLPADAGDLAPPGYEHPLADVFDPKLGIRDPADIFPVADTHLSPIGLNARDRIRARDLTVQAAALAYQMNQSITYTMDGRRWDPIARNRKAWRGEVGRFEDCSSFATWCVWHGLTHFGIGDVVNGAGFRAGWTGTMIEHGVRVARADILRGDMCFYATAAGEINHVAVYVGGGRVISHGGEPGPSKLDMGYRTIAQIRRYIRP